MEPRRSTTMQWRKSSRSVTGECTEVASDGRAVFVRDSKDRHGSVLSFSTFAWRMFLATVKEETFEPDGEPPQAR